MKLSVITHDNKRLFVHVDGTVHVQQVSAWICRLGSIPWEIRDEVMISAGQRLERERTLEECGISDGSFIFFLQKLRGEKDASIKTNDGFLQS
jgi:hypothetical protein